MSSALEVQAPGQALRSARRLIAPLALAQFICSFAGSNMNVMIGDISHDLNTDVKGVQTVITLFLLTMAILMIPCSKLTDRWGRKRCLTMGLALFGVGALLSAIAPGLGVLIICNSILEGVGTALLIPPVYILATLWFTDMTSRAWAFGAISGMGGIGAAAGPLDWRCHRNLDRLAGGIHLPGVDRRHHRHPQPQPERSARRRPEAPL